MLETHSAKGFYINRLISLDPVLTGQVLKLINSAFYGLPNRISSLTRAIIMLGINTVKNLVLATSVLACFKGPKYRHTRLFIDDYWAHSLLVGVASKAIARMKDVPAFDRETYFVAGLLHDLGRLPLMACLTDSYEQILRSAEERQTPQFEVEREQMGFDHSYVGYLIATKWHLDEALQNTIRYHHLALDPDIKSSPLMYSVSLANLMAHQFQNNLPEKSSPEKTAIDNAEFHALAELNGTSEDELMGLHSHVEVEVEKAKVFLNIDGKR